MEALKEEQGVGESVDDLRAQLDGLVDEAVHSFGADERAASEVADRVR
jgi:hypothetical protein